MQLLTVDDICWTIEPLGEDLPVRGNAIASGDAELDRQVEDEILARLEYDIWAWTCVKVTGIYQGILEESDYIGCCSYSDEADFVGGGYYTDMQKTILQNLNRKLADLCQCD